MFFIATQFSIKIVLSKFFLHQPCSTFISICSTLSLTRSTLCFVMTVFCFALNIL